MFHIKFSITFRGRIHIPKNVDWITQKDFYLATIILAIFFSFFPFFYFWKEAIFVQGDFSNPFGVPNKLLKSSPPKCGNHHINYLSNITTYWINVPSPQIYIFPASISLSNSIPLFQIYRRRVHFFCSLLSLQKKCILYYYLFGFTIQKTTDFHFLYHFQPSKTRWCSTNFYPSRKNSLFDNSFHFFPQRLYPFLKRVPPPIYPLNTIACFLNILLRLF